MNTRVNTNAKHHNRHSIRLQGYDYSKTGVYFVTACVQDHECLFGEITNGVMLLNTWGTIVRDTWEWLAIQYPYVKLDEYVVMPNHFHGILWICDTCCRGGSRTAPTEHNTILTDHNTTTTDPTDKAALENESPIIKIKPVGRLVGAFKTVSAKQINRDRNTPGKTLWQRDFYDHIGRDEEDNNRIRQYIKNNPLNWNEDEENPLNRSPRYVAMMNPQKRYLKYR